MNDMDKKIKEAAGSHFPSYDDGAWKKMESLLDKHLPQRKDGKRRIIFFLLLFLLVGGGGAYFLISGPLSSGRSAVVTEQNNQPQNDQLKARQNKTDKASENLSSRSESENKLSTKDDAIETNNNESLTIKLRHKQYIDATRNAINNRMKKMINPLELSQIKTDANEDIKKEDINPIADVNDLNQKMDVLNDEKKTQEEFNNIEQRYPNQDESTSVASVKNNKQKKSNSIFISLSTGPDVSMVGLNKPGTTKLLGGVGIGYTLNDRLTLRTGFYTSRKIYSAAKEDYKPDAPPVNYMYLESISANCKVYEVPLSLSYHFERSSKQNFFASVGLSSYFMKKEDYDYLYKYPGNPPVSYTHRYSFTNENNHFFSVVGISAGYQRNISKTFSMTVEPYVKFPIKGVGYGNVKLNGAGVLFSATMRPFQNAEKKKKDLLPLNTTGQ